MISVSFTNGGDSRLIPVCAPRRPDETLHDYLLRSRHDLSVHIRMLEATSDAQAELFASERSRARRTMVLLAVGEAGFAAASYVALDLNGLAGTGHSPLLGAMVGSGTLAGAAAAIGIVSVRDRVPSWLLTAQDFARRLLRRHMRIIEPSATTHHVPSYAEGVQAAIAMERTPESERLGYDLDGDPEIEAILEERTVDRLEARTFLWGLGLPVTQAAIITILLCTLRVVFGVPFDVVMMDVPLIMGACLIGGLFLLAFSDLASSGIARLALWWRRR